MSRHRIVNKGEEDRRGEEGQKRIIKGFKGYKEEKIKDIEVDIDIVNSLLCLLSEFV